MAILGISAYFHDSAAAVIQNGVILSAAQEERYSRIKHDSSFPARAIGSCLNTAGLIFSDITDVVFYDKPLLKFERILESYFSVAPKGFSSFRKAMPVWLREKLFLRDLLFKELKNAGFSKLKIDQIRFSEHHLSHAASAYYPSEFEESAILTIDGVGEWATTSICHGKGNEISVLQEVHFPHSLGLLYSAFTYYCGFRVNSGEYKLMGLAPYGNPRYADLILENIIDLREDGSFRLDMDYFNYLTGLRMTGEKFHKLFGSEPREPESEITQFYKDIAASIQRVTEMAVIKMAAHAMKITGSQNLCLAGGVALNCVANGRILQDLKPKRLWIQPASGDAGGAVGAALAFEFSRPGFKMADAEPVMKNAFLGDSFSDEEIEKSLVTAHAVFVKLGPEKILKNTAAALAEGKAVGWFQGRMEFGPRALGNRSILADPRSKNTQKELNLKIKFRESFRPFAPVLPEKLAAQYFKNAIPSPYMMLTFDVLNDEIAGKLPATTHVDDSARVQTVNGSENPLFYALLNEFHSITGCPVLVNTSFNVRGEPIVCTPDDAYRCFMSTGLDVVVIGNYYLEKIEQPSENIRTPQTGVD